MTDAPRTFRHRLAALLRCRRGFAAAEFALVATGVIVIAATLPGILGPSVRDAYATVGTTIERQVSGISAR